MTTSLSCSHVVCFICNNEICQIGRKYSLEINLKIYTLLNVYSDSTVNETIQISFKKAKHRIFLKSVEMPIFHDRGRLGCRPCTISFQTARHLLTLEMFRFSLLYTSILQSSLDCKKVLTPENSSTGCKSSRLQPFVSLAYTTWLDPLWV